MILDNPVELGNVHSPTAIGFGGISRFWEEQVNEWIDTFIKGFLFNFNVHPEGGRSIWSNMNIGFVELTATRSAHLHSTNLL